MALLLSFEMRIFTDYLCIAQGYKLPFAEKELPYVLEKKEYVFVLFKVGNCLKKNIQGLGGKNKGLVFEGKKVPFLGCRTIML